MCGIAGYYHQDGGHPEDQELVEKMLSRLAHRGPDEFGVYLDDRVGLGSARLSIVDVMGGTQPIGNEDGTVWIVFNGEIYNHSEIRKEMESHGHQVVTRADTEAIVHLYEEMGSRCVERLNGQFAFALWDIRDSNDPRLILARDRVGIRPLFFTRAGGTFLFGSEIKALFAHPEAVRRFDPVALHQVLTLWATLGTRTPFAKVYQIPPAHVVELTRRGMSSHQYWDFEFRPDLVARSDASYAAELRALLQDATRLRLNADVEVGAYLSGGIDSSTITHLALTSGSSQIRTFSVGFDRADFDEGPHQERMVGALGTNHLAVDCHDTDIGRYFPEVVRHAEWPILRTAPAPLYLLSRLVQKQGIKVVLTGEGADEILCGYNIFKENRVRRFWARRPDSDVRAKLLCQLYPYLTSFGDNSEYLKAFFAQHLTETDRLEYSHLVRWSNNAFLRRMLSQDLKEAAKGYDPIVEAAATLCAHGSFRDWSPLAQAQYIELTILMSGYLLSSQGDRMLMAHSVEGRFPFLDHRVIEFAGRLPDRVKLRGLNEKFVLKRAMERELPPKIVRRVKQPYRAPLPPSFLADAADRFGGVLSDRYARESNIFEPRAVAAIWKKLEGAAELGERDKMAIAGVVSTLLLHHLLLVPPPPAGPPRLRLARCQRAPIAGRVR